MNDAGTMHPTSDEGARWWHGIARWEIALVAVWTIAFSILGLLLIERGAPMGHDESVYSLRARDIVGDVDGHYWAAYRAPGLSLLMAPAEALVGTDWAMRLVVLGFAALGIPLTWLWGRHLFGARAGVVAAGLLAFTPGWLRNGWLALPDVPGATLGLASVLAFALATRDGRVRRWGLVVIPLAGLSTAVRFGAPYMIALGIGLIALARWRTMLSRLPLVAMILSGTATAMGAVLLVPAVTGSSVAPLSAARALRSGKDLPIGSALPDFWVLAPQVLGTAIGIAVALGLSLALIGLFRTSVPRVGFALTMLITALGVLAVGLSLGHGEGRYLTPMMPFLFAGAGAGLATLFRPSLLPVGIATAVALLVASPVLTWNDGEASSETLRRRFGVLRQVSSMIGQRTAEPCAVLTSYAPQVGWYASCDAYVYPSATRANDVEEARVALRSLLGTITSGRGDTQALALLGARGKRQPEGPGLIALDELTERRLFEVGDPTAGPLRHFTVDLLRASEA